MKSIPYYFSHLPFYRLNKLGLDALASSILGIKLDKSLETRCSDWESDSLTKRQVAYAANDAIVSLQIFLALVLGKFDSKRKMDSLEYLKTNVFISQRSDTGWTTSTSQFMHYVFDQTKCQVSEVCSSPVNAQSVAFSDVFTKHATSLCQGLIDLDFKQKNTGDKLKKLPSQKYKVCEEKTMKAKNGTVPIRTQPFYQNCYIIAPDGTVLCTCDKRKAEWYVTRNLGESCYHFL